MRLLLGNVPGKRRDVKSVRAWEQKRYKIVESLARAHTRPNHPGTRIDGAKISSWGKYGFSIFSTTTILSEGPNAESQESPSWFQQFSPGTQRWKLLSRNIERLLGPAC